MPFLFDSFKGWKKYHADHHMSLHDVVLEYEQVEKDHSIHQVKEGLARSWQVMKEAVMTGLEQEMKSRSGMISGGAQKVFRYPKAVLTREFQELVARALAAKEVNSCMGRIVAAPTAGASGIMPGVLFTLQEIHGITDEAIIQAMLVSAGIGLIIEQRASLAGAVGGCQAR